MLYSLEIAHNCKLVTASTEDKLNIIVEVVLYLLHVNRMDYTTVLRVGELAW